MKQLSRVKQNLRALVRQRVLHHDGREFWLAEYDGRFRFYMDGFAMEIFKWGGLRIAIDAIREGVLL